MRKKARQQDWDLQAELLARIKKNGGWTNCHTHLDRAYTISLQTLTAADKHLHVKWGLVDALKKKSTVDQIYDRMAMAIEKQLEQGVTAIGSFIDVDEIIKDKSIRAAERIRDRYGKALEIRFINQCLKGVLNSTSREWFDLGAQFVDIIGGLPARDVGKEAEHLDVLFSTAKRLKKAVHVHVDQLNTAKEKEIALLLRKVEQHGMQGKVSAIHGVSLSAQKKAYRNAIYAKMRANNVSLICCPTAWIDSRRTEKLAPTHNAIAPVEELVAVGVVVGVGTDNIADVYKPFTDGSMWMELRFLLESCHYYDLDKLVKIATSNGRGILGLKNVKSTSL